MQLSFSVLASSCPCWGFVLVGFQVMLSLRWKLCLVPKGSEQMGIVFPCISNFKCKMDPVESVFPHPSTPKIYKQPLVLRSSYSVPIYLAKSCLQVQPQETDTALHCSTLFFSCLNSSFHLQSMVKKIIENLSEIHDLVISCHCTPWPSQQTLDHNVIKEIIYSKQKKK